MEKSEPIHFIKNVSNLKKSRKKLILQKFEPYL